ncbi:MAG: carboxypeptidase-like regulatory domain-containing protein [Euryarchaeota archaeon]|nr:carboxypeptidase-like regulatory domain-containing protein [Euryarchaeota archaeon]
MRIKTPLVILLFLVGALSGCVDDDPLDSTGTSEGTAEPAAVGEETGSVTGRIMDDAFEPLPGANVTLFDHEARFFDTRSDSKGRYTLNAVPPGPYVMLVTAPGHFEKKASLDVPKATVVERDLFLERLPSDAPYREGPLQYVGFIDAALAYQVEPAGVGCIVESVGSRAVKSCSGWRFDFGNTKNGEIKINVTEDVESLLVEMRWDPKGPLGKDLTLDLLCPEVPRSRQGAVLDTEHDCYFASPGRTSPLVHRVDADHWHERGYNHTGFWAARVFGSHGAVGTYDLTGVDAGAAYSQDFEVWVTVFHKDPAPDGFSGFPDA